MWTCWTRAAPLIPDIISMHHTQSYHVDQSVVQNAPRNRNTEYWPNSTEYRQQLRCNYSDHFDWDKGFSGSQSWNPVINITEQSGPILNRLGYNQHRLSQAKVSMYHTSHQSFMRHTAGITQLSLCINKNALLYFTKGPLFININCLFLLVTSPPNAIAINYRPIKVLGLWNHYSSAQRQQMIKQNHILK